MRMGMMGMGNGGGGGSSDGGADKQKEREARIRDLLQQNPVSLDALRELVRDVDDPRPIN